MPWLESISAGASSKSGENLAEPPLRMAFIFMPNGVRPDYWTPPGDGEAYEITTHLRGEAGARQRDGARIGLAHVVGLGTCAAVHILEKVSA